MTVLEVVIGLVFIYLIYSLFITLLAEMFSTWMGMRARLLRQGLTNLLTDLQEKEKGSRWAIVRRFFLMPPACFEFTRAGEFYRQPSIKSLSQAADRSLFPFVFTKGKPSYISKENFSATLINMLRTAGNGVHDWGKISFSIKYNALHFDPHTDQQLKALHEDADDDMEVFILKLEAWYQEMMDRINGWYKRKMQLVIFWIGFIVVAIFHVDTFEVVNKLSEDKAARTEFLQLAQATVDSNSRVSKMLQKLDDTYMEEELLETLRDVRSDMDKTTSYLGNGWEFSPVLDTVELVPQPDSVLRITIDTLIDLKKKLNYSRNELANSLKQKDTTDNTKVISGLLSYINEREHIHDSLLQIVNNKYNLSLTQLNQLKGNSLIGLFARNTCQKAWYILCQSNPFEPKFWGFLVTALALSLGAPFWFDLLKKLVAIRGTGVNPEEKKVKKTDLIDEWAKKRKEKSNMGKTIRNVSPIDHALFSCRRMLEQIPGVIAVNKILDFKLGGRSRYRITVLHDESCDLSLIPDNIPIPEFNFAFRVEKTLGNYAIYDHLDTGINEDSESTPAKDYSIHASETGTIAGLLHNPETNKFCLLTCAHVLSANGSSIVYQGKHSLEKYGILNKIVWSNFLDAGIVDINDAELEKNYPLIQPDYKVDRADLHHRTPVHIICADGSKKDAIIVHEDYMCTFKHKNGEHFSLHNLIAITGKDNRRPTNPGDSGALVVTLDNKSVGIVIGGDLLVESENPRWSYILRMSTILRVLNIGFIKDKID